MTGAALNQIFENSYQQMRQTLGGPNATQLERSAQFVSLLFKENAFKGTVTRSMDTIRTASQNSEIFRELEQFINAQRAS